MKDKERDLNKFAVDSANNEENSLSKKEIRRRKKAEKEKANNEKILKKYGITNEFGEEEDSILRIIALVLKGRFPNILIMSVLVFVCACVYFYTSNIRMSTAVMMLNYELSSKGLAPNETRFSISDFKCEEVMNLAIKNAGAEGKVTASQLAGNIAVYETLNRNPNDPNNYYIPTSYKIYYRNRMEITDVKSEDMLQIICNAYTEYFHNEYTMSPTVLSYDYSDISNIEYSELASLFTARIDEISRYLDMRNNQAGKFKSSENGETFNSIKKLADNLKNYTLDSYRAYIWENGIVRNRDNYKNTLFYLNDKYERDQKEHMNEYDIRRDVINYFSTAMATSILIPTENKNEYYMSRTKTGVDYLASDADMHLAVAKDLELSSAKNNDKIAKIKSVPSSAEIQKADSMIENIINELQHIEKLATETDKEYNNYDSKNYLTFSYKKPGISDRIPKKNVLIITFVFFVLATFVFYKECSTVLKKRNKS